MIQQLKSNGLRVHGVVHKLEENKKGLINIQTIKK